MIRKKSIIFILISFLVFITVNKVSAQKEIFIKQIEFKLDYISDIDYENEYFMTLKLNKGSKYIFKIVNHFENAQGEAVLELLDVDNLILTNEISGKYFKNVSFQCNKTGFYDILVRFKENKLGNSKIDILLVQ